MLEKTLVSPLDWKEIQPVNPKGNQSWLFIGRTDVEAETPVLWPPEEPTHLKRPWCWESLKTGGEGDNRGWGGWIVSSTRWTWVWASSGRWWRTGKPGFLSSTGLQTVGHDWATEQQQFPFHRWRLLNVFQLLSTQNSNQSSKKAQSSLSSHQLHEIWLKSF